MTMRQRFLILCGFLLLQLYTISIAFPQVTDFQLAKSQDDVEIVWNTGTAPFRVLRSQTPTFISGNYIVAPNVPGGPIFDGNALGAEESYFYQVVAAGQASPGLYDLNEPRPVPSITSLTPDTGQAFALVTIDGAGYPDSGSGMVVMFGALAANVLTVTPTQLTVVVPAGTVTDEVRVCVPDVCSNPKRFAVPVGPMFQDITSLSFEVGTGSLWLGDRGSSDEVIEVDSSGTALPRAVATMGDVATVGPSPAIPGDIFGASVALSGDTAIIGAREDGGGFPVTRNGSAWVFVRNGNTWSFQEQLVALDGAEGDIFGTAVDVDGDTAIVGAPGNDELALETGAAYIFVRNGTSWSPQEKLVAPDADIGDFFGGAVAIDDNTVVVGAPTKDQHVGAAYVYFWNGTTWTFQQKLEVLTTNGRFGRSVSIHGNTVIVGTSEFFVGPGSAYIFTRTGTTWGAPTHLTASDGVIDDDFGHSVSLNGDTAVVGATQHGTTGAAYVYVWNGAMWIEDQKLMPSDLASGDGFGNSVSTDGATVLVGAFDQDAVATSSGATYVFGGAGWVQQQKLTPTEPAFAANFGRAVSIDGGRALISTVSDLGRAFIFPLDTGCAAPMISNVSPGDSTGNVYCADSTASSSNLGAVRSIDSTDQSNAFFRAAGAADLDPVWARAVAASDGEPDVVYVLDGNGNTVRRVPATGSIDTNWGNTVFAFNDPAGARFDSDGNLYVSSTTDIYKISPSEVVTPVASGFQGAAGMDLSEATGIVTLLVADEVSGEILLVNGVTGEKETIATGFTNPVAAVFSEANNELFCDVAEPTQIFRLPDPQVRFALKKKGRERVLTNKHRTTDRYPSGFQTQPNEIKIQATVLEKSPVAGVKVYFRVVDVRDTAPYASTGVPDNKDGSGVVNPTMAISDANGVAATTLTVTNTFSGDNYRVEASLTPTQNWKTIARTGIIEVWKRGYIEYDQMYKVGETITADSGFGTNRVDVANPSTFAEGDEVHLISASTPYGEISTVAVGGIMSDHILLDDILMNLYPDSDGGLPPSNDKFPYSFVAKVSAGAYDAQPSAGALARVYDDTFTEWVFVGGGSFLPLWSVVDSTTPQTAKDWIQVRTVHFFENLDVFNPPSAAPNHVQLVAAARYDPLIVPPPIPPQDVVGGASKGDVDATNWTWIFVKGILDGCNLVGCTNQQRDNILDDFKNHELAHQWQVNKPQDPDGHDTKTSWDSNGLCQMNENRDFSMPTKFHADLVAPFDLFCIRGHVDDLDQDLCSWP